MRGEKITYTSAFADEGVHIAYENALARVEGGLGEVHPVWIDGKAIVAGDAFDVWSPIDRGIRIGRFQKGDATLAQHALKRLHRGFHGWQRTDWKERLSAIESSADLFWRDRFELSALLTLEVGKTRTEALAEVAEAVDMLRYYCRIYEREEAFIRPLASDMPGEVPISLLRPYGAWAVISPFNFPIALMAGMAGAALLTGNTVLLKPTSVAPLSGLKVYESFVRAGIPPEALSFFTGPGEAFGEAVVSMDELAGIAFTGSRAAGMWLYRRIAERLRHPRPIVLEMGSKNPCIVTASADMDAAMEGVVRGAFGFGGQKCSATSRVYVQEEIAAEFLAGLVQMTNALRVGDPRKRDTFMGPLIDQRALAVLHNAVTEAESAGGEIAAGGKVLAHGEFGNGYYAEPTVVIHLPRGHRLFREELFVPFLIVDTFETIEEAVKEANDTDYGLTAGIFSRKEAELEYFFREIEFGVCYSNRRGGATTGAWPGAQPFGGWKGSGSTGKGVGGPYYLYSFVREQSQTRCG
ncbi:MAG: aldehyde dehydrogenase family protein [Methanomicrobiales archaeon]|nr:aldehyde dehydrogenase family protein [Methanomicrobiales archaeon]